MAIDLDMAELKPSVWNLLLILIAVLIMVPLAKWALNARPIPGLTELVNAI